MSNPGDKMPAQAASSDGSEADTGKDNSARTGEQLHRASNDPLSNAGRLSALGLIAVMVLCSAIGVAVYDKFTFQQAPKSGATCVEAQTELQQSITDLSNRVSSLQQELGVERTRSEAKVEAVTQSLSRIDARLNAPPLRSKSQPHP